ncbi:hypothetical protein Dimus_000751 [Dionaea muscipula]
MESRRRVKQQVEPSHNCRLELIKNLSFLFFCDGNSISEVKFRADEWDVNKWACEEALKVVNKVEEYIIRLEDKSTESLAVNHHFPECTSENNFIHRSFRNPDF